MPLRFAWEKPAPSTLCYAMLCYALLCTAVCFTPLHCMPLDPFPVRHARAALRYCKIFIEIRQPNPPLPEYTSTGGFWLMHVSGGRAATFSPCFSPQMELKVLF